MFKKKPILKTAAIILAAAFSFGLAISTVSYRKTKVETKAADDGWTYNSGTFNYVQDGATYTGTLVSAYYYYLGNYDSTKSTYVEVIYTADVDGSSITNTFAITMNNPENDLSATMDGWWIDGVWININTQINVSIQCVDAKWNKIVMTQGNNYIDGLSKVIYVDSENDLWEVIFDTATYDHDGDDGDSYKLTTVIRNMDSGESDTDSDIMLESVTIDSYDPDSTSGYLTGRNEDLSETQAVRLFAYEISTPEYAVNFTADGDVTGSMEQQSAYRNVEFLVPDCGFTMEGSTFVNWQDQNSGTPYSVGDKIFVTDNLTLVAQFEEYTEPVSSFQIVDQKLAYYFVGFGTTFYYQDLDEVPSGEVAYFTGYTAVFERIEDYLEVTISFKFFNESDQPIDDIEDVTLVLTNADYTAVDEGIYSIVGTCEDLQSEALRIQVQSVDTSSIVSYIEGWNYIPEDNALIYFDGIDVVESELTNVYVDEDESIVTLSYLYNGGGNNETFTMSPGYYNSAEHIAYGVIDGFNDNEQLTINCGDAPVEYAEPDPVIEYVTGWNYNPNDHKLMWNPSSATSECDPELTVPNSIDIDGETATVYFVNSGNHDYDPETPVIFNNARYDEETSTLTGIPENITVYDVINQEETTGAITINTYDVVPSIQPSNVTSITLLKDGETCNDLSVNVGDSFFLDVALEPADAEANLVWASGNTSVVTVSEEGLIEAVGAGSTYVEVTDTLTRYSASCTITVLDDTPKPVGPIEIVLEEQEIIVYVDDFFEVPYKILPEGTEVDLVWTAEDGSIAEMVDGNYVLGLSVGSTTVTVTDENQTTSATFTVYVVERPVPVQPENPISEETIQDINNAMGSMDLNSDQIDQINTAISENQDYLSDEAGSIISQAISGTTISTDQEVAEAQKELVVTVVEAGVKVDAGKATNIADAQDIDKALPDNVHFSVEGEIEEFYQRQMVELFGGQMPSKSASRAGAPTYSIDTDTKGKEGAEAVEYLASEQALYENMVDFVDTGVDHMGKAALKLRKCSGESVTVQVKSYVTVVKVSSYREFDKEAADKEFVEAVYKAILLSMQNEVISILEKEHKPSGNAEKEAQYKKELEAVQDIETFEIMVTEVLRQKYVALTGEQIDDVEDFMPIYWEIFTAWALDKPSPYAITLEELTQTTIEQSTGRAKAFSVNSKLTATEWGFIAGIAGGAAIIIAASAVIPTVLKKKKAKEGNN